MSRRILYVALFASLTLNVFFVGAVVGAALTGARLYPPPPEARPRNPVAAAVRTLSPEQQAAWRAQMPGYAQVYGPRLRQARQLSREALMRLNAETHDDAAVLADLRKARSVEFEGRQEMDRRIVAFAATLPPQDRARFVAALTRPPLGRRGAPEGRGLALPER